MRTRNLAVALAIALPLVAAGYLGWVYYSARVEFADRGQSIPPHDPNAPPPRKWFHDPPVDPADLYGTWTSTAEAGGGANINRREAVLTFAADGKLAWTTRATVGTAPPMEIVEKYDYSSYPGPTLMLMLSERTVGGQAAKVPVAQEPRMLTLEWKGTDKSVFQLRTDANDPGRPHLLFRKSPAGKGWRLFGWDVTPPARR